MEGNKNRFFDFDACYVITILPHPITRMWTCFTVIIWYCGYLSVLVYVRIVKRNKWKKYDDDWWLIMKSEQRWGYMIPDWQFETSTWSENHTTILSHWTLMEASSSSLSNSDRLVQRHKTSSINPLASNFSPSYHGHQKSINCMIHH